MVFRKLAKDSAIYGSADFVSKAIAFFVFPLIAAALSPLAFGALELITTTTALLGMVMNCGLNNAVQRFYWDKETTGAHRPVIVSTGLAVLMAFGLLSIISGLAIMPLVYPHIRNAQLPLSQMAIVSALFLMAASQWNQYALDVVRLHFAPWKFFSLELLSKVLTAMAAVVAVVYFHWGVDGLLSAQAGIALLVFPLALFMVKKDITSRLSRGWARELVSFGYPFIYAGVAYWLFSSMDRWMLASLSSVEEVGIYSVASRFSMVVLFASTAFGQAWSPAAMKIRTENPDGYRKIYAQVLVLLLFIMISLSSAIALFSGELISLIMPSEYVTSAMPLAILCLGIALQATQQVTAVGISLEKKTFLFARLAWLTAFVNLLLNWLLIPAYGASGAALATAISYLILTGSYLYFTQQLHPLPVPWKSMSATLLMGVAIEVVSLIWMQTSVSWKITGFKLVLFLLYVLAGLSLLPVKIWGSRRFGR